MLRSGMEYLASLRDKRRVYSVIDLVEDVTTHPAFRNAARSFANIWDRKRAPEHSDAMSYEEDGERFSTWYLKATTKDDLRQRAECHRRVAEWSYGLLGRSPDHVASFVTGLALNPDLFEANRSGFGENLTAFYDLMRRRDQFACYVVLPPQGARSPEMYNREATRVPALQVTAEDDAGITLNGMKMLGTAGVFADMVWVGNLLPLAPEMKSQAVTCAVPANTPGLSMWVRKSFELQAVSDFDNPFSSRFDETDAIVIFDNVKVPWESVFLLDDVVLSREMHFRTPSHVMGNHQSVVRFLEKLKLMTGVAHKAAEMNGVLQVPAVRDTLGKLAVGEAGLSAMIVGQIEDAESMVPGFLNVNRRFLYSSLHWCTNNYYQIAETVRELLGAGPFQMPADASILTDAKLRETFEIYCGSPGSTAIDRFRFMKLAWDYLGSDFAGRHTQYERFYAGPQHVNVLYNFGLCPWSERQRAVEDIMATMAVPPLGP
jgi:4-hydroxyphenylacetate 3-monooxygenase